MKTLANALEDADDDADVATSGHVAMVLGGGAALTSAAPEPQCQLSDVDLEQMDVNVAQQVALEAGGERRAGSSRCDEAPVTAGTNRASLASMLDPGSRFLRGISVTKLLELAARPECIDPDGQKRSVTRMWSDGERAWARQTLPEGWTLEMIGADHDWDNWRTGEYSDVTPSARHSKMYKYISPSGAEHPNRAPPETTTMYHLARDADPDSAGRATHMCSYPWAMPFIDIVDAVAHALKDWSEGEAFIFLDCLSDGAHDVIDLAPVEIEGHEDRVWLQEKETAIREMPGGVVQVCSKWDDPERLRRGWMMLESIFAVASGASVTYAMCPDQERLMVAELRKAGPEAILDIVDQVEVRLDKITCSKPDDAEKVFAKIEEIAAMQDSSAARAHRLGKSGGLRHLEQMLANSTRKAYAQAIELEFEQQWFEEHSSNMTVGRSPKVLDLGHQLAALWAMTDDKGKSRSVFEKVLRALERYPVDWNEGAVARRDRTAAALVALILQMVPSDATADEKDAALKDAHSVAKQALGGELAVSFQGISVAFLVAFGAEHNAELNYLSTDAVVERVIKPSSKPEGFGPRSFGGPGRNGRAFIETVHDHWKGKPTFFLSHAWRQTFHVSDCEWRGGAIQALEDSVVCEACARLPQRDRKCAACTTMRENTFVWFDIFCVNQHLRSPHGGLQAFAFDPLRNAIVEADEGLKMFLETWDDPATLSRVWCLEELRVAMLFGKEVQICMPQNAMLAFRKRAEENPVGLLEAIDMVVERISIDHASATFESDRKQVFDSMKASVGSKNLNMFCQEIMRKALMDAAFPDGVHWLSHVRESHVRHQAERSREDRWAKIYEGMLSEADSMKTAQKIKIRRAVALMRLRNDEQDAQGRKELRHAALLASRYYGTRAAETQDIVRQLSRTDSLRQDSSRSSWPVKSSLGGLGE